MILFDNIGWILNNDLNEYVAYIATNSDHVESLRVDYNEIKTQYSRIWQDENFRSVQSKVSALEINLQNTLDANIEGLKNRIEALEKNTANSYAANSGYPNYSPRDIETRVARLEQRLNGMAQLMVKPENQYNDKFTQLKSDLELRYNQLEEQLEQKYEAKLEQLEQKYEAKLEQLEQKYEAKLEQLEQKYEARLKELEEKLKEPVVVPSPSENQPIDYFVIEEIQDPCFSSDVEQVGEKIKFVADTTDLVKVIEANPLPDTEAYLKIVRSYSNRVAKLQSLDLDNYDEDELSDAVTNKFFKTVKDNLLSNLVIALYRSLKSELAKQGEAKEDKQVVARLKKVIEALNTYLRSCGIYNRKVEVNMCVSEQDIDEMQPNFIPSKNVEQNNVITDVECLPYFIKYLDDDGEMERYCQRGSMIVAQFKG